MFNNKFKTLFYIVMHHSQIFYATIVGTFYQTKWRNKSKSVTIYNIHVCGTWKAHVAYDYEIVWEPKIEGQQNNLVMKWEKTLMF